MDPNAKLDAAIEKLIVSAHDAGYWEGLMSGVIITGVFCLLLAVAIFGRWS